MCAGISLPKYSAISLHILVFRIARQDHFLASERLASCVGLLRLALLNSGQLVDGLWPVLLVRHALEQIRKNLAVSHTGVKVRPDNLAHHIL